MKRIASLLALLLTLGLAATSSAQSLTGTIEGKVTDEQGGVLPGVTVTLTGRQGSQTTVTDETGLYRFVGLNPGTYDVKAELSGFGPGNRNAIDVTIGKTVSVPVALKVGGIAEAVDVTANASTIDATSAATDNTLSTELLQSMPINVGNFNSATALLNYSPGVNNGSGFGGDGSYGNSLLIDGVDTRDPEGGSAWVFYNFNIVEEVQVGGIGAPAEYGGFSGAVVNTITKSGGNKYSGLFEIRHTNDGLAGTNIDSDVDKQNPALKGGSVLTKLNDYTVQLGGPLRKDKVFWWFSAQRYALEQDPTGPRTIQTEVSPRYNGKLTFQLTPSDTFIASFQFDNYNVTGRTGLAGTDSTDNQTLRQDSPEAIWNGQYRKVFGSSTFLEAKFTGYWGYYYLDPKDTTPARIDLDTGSVYKGGAGYLYYADRNRNQLNVSVSRFAEAAGRHNFKFGMEIERSRSKSRFDYMNGVYYVDYAGEPYLAYGYGYLIDGKNRRQSYYAQDAWQVGRLTANLGVRLDHIRGASPNDSDKTVYTPKLGIGPRLGATLDLNGKGTFIAKGFWGRYYEGASFNPWQRATSGFTDYVSYEVDARGGLHEFDRYKYPIYGIDPDIEHLGVDEFNVALESQLRRDMRFSVTYIQRDYTNFINSVHPTATWTPVNINNPLTNTPLGVFRFANKSAAERNVYIRNIDGFQYKDPNGNVLATIDAYRAYKGVMAVLTKSYSNRWQAQASYVWSKTEGTVNNSGTASVTGRAWEHPAVGIVNGDGLMSNDRTHEFKIFGGYQIPKIEVSLNAYYRGISGTPWAYFVRASGSSSALNWSFPPIFSSQRAVFLEPRGSRRMDFQHQVDLRAEKTFNIDVHRFGVFVDVQNLMNTATITGIQNRYPSALISGYTVLPGAPTSVQGARQLTFGGRWSF